ncbi:hypothetical protein HPB49_017143 [Dermacentor silvarum]|uniref:Uncharacterized protein n=1 Tax=Dermacentor silvarum TaxID=543639 RepID=A0ACB8CSE9_DERSI|nr:hypothetical protein HPB49_017143 [Dermacentor silvarum]
MEFSPLNKAHSMTSPTFTLCAWILIFLDDVNGLFSNLHDLIMLNISANRVRWFDYALIPIGLQWLDIHDNQVEALGNYFELESI